MNANDFRRIALGMDGAVESSHMNHPDFRVNGRIFATLDHDESRGMVKLSPEEQAEFTQRNPGTFVPAAGAWGRQGCTLVTVADVDESVLGEAVTLAWQAAVRVSVAKTPKTRRARPSKRRPPAKRARASKRPRRSRTRR
jgi:predicted DNA-binding protein (MmcQ/YjbR family)